MPVALPPPVFVQFKDKRDNTIHQKRVAAKTPEQAQAALATARGGPQNVEILVFDGVALAENERPLATGDAPPVVDNAARQVRVPTLEEIESATDDQVRAIVKYMRTTTLHAAYYDAMPLKWPAKKMKQAIKARHYPPEGEATPEVPKG